MTTPTHRGAEAVSIAHLVPHLADYFGLPVRPHVAIPEGSAVFLGMREILMHPADYSVNFGRERHFRPDPDFPRDSPPGTP